MPLSWNEIKSRALALSKGGGGLRKVRWSRTGSGKSGGVRVIYFVRNAREEIVLLAIYAKSERENLSPKQLLEIRNALASFER